MTESTFAWHIRRLYRANLEGLLASVADLDEETMRWRTGRSTSIAFNVWHCARWADHLGSILGESTDALRAQIGPRPEIWSAERLGERWGFPRSGLGHVETGMGMDEQLSTQLPLPAEDVLLDYAKRAFAFAQETVARIDESEYLKPAQIDMRRVPWLSTPNELGHVLSWITAYARHDARHLGMIEALKGVHGLRGTASA